MIDTINKVEASFWRRIEEVKREPDEARAIQLADALFSDQLKFGELILRTRQILKYIENSKVEAL